MTTGLPHATTDTLGLVHRPRRNRRTDWARRLVRENVVTADDLIWPLFLIEGEKRRVAVPSMPGVERFSVDEAVRAAMDAAEAGIPALCFFPMTDADKKDPRGLEAQNADNLVCRAVRAIKAEVPHIGLITDAALDPYTSHGHDGVMAGDEIVNDETVRLLCEQSLNQARAGADIIAPSDMMDGRVGAIRAALDGDGFEHVQIMSYAAKYASAFYGPFRDAIGTKAVLVGDKRTYQMDPANSNEALREVAADIEEGAGHGDGEARHALSRHHSPGEGDVRGADLRLPGLRRVRDDHGRRAERLDRRRPGDDGEPRRLQAGRLRRRPDLFCADGRAAPEGRSLRRRPTAIAEENTGAPVAQGP